MHMNFTDEDVAYIKHHLLQPCPAFNKIGECFCGCMKDKQCPLGYMRRLFNVKVDRDNHELTDEQYKAFVQYVLALCFTTDYCIARNGNRSTVQCSDCAFNTEGRECIRQIIRHYKEY